jgi:hypothetical protein
VGFIETAGKETPVDKKLLIDSEQGYENHSHEINKDSLLVTRYSFHSSLIQA